MLAAIHWIALDITVIPYIPTATRAKTSATKYTGTRASTCVRSPFRPITEITATMTGVAAKSINSRTIFLIGQSLDRR